MTNSPEELGNLINSHHEWLIIRASGKAFAVRKEELELAFERNRTLFGFLDDRGFQTWRIENFQTTNAEISLNLVRNFGKEREKIRLVPRILAKDLSAWVELARLEKANQIAGIIKDNFSSVKLVRVELNKENGRFAQIIFENSNGVQTAVLSDVSETLTPEILLSAAILRLEKLRKRKKKPIETIWILSEKRAAGNLRKLHALLRENWKSRIIIKEISFETVKPQESDSKKETNLNELPKLSMTDLWRGRPKEIKLTENLSISQTAGEIIALSPENIDVVFSRRGETLRFRGLPFARVRKIFGTEKVWFGIEKSRQILAEDNFDELLELVENLKTFRCFESPNRRHEFYRQAPEAWLEALLRRNIKLLDANLRLSPLYHQFRTGRDKIDLLALRKDGRLTVIELKAATDREMIFQAADYWRQIEWHRRKGNLQRSRLFGDLEISDHPAICYLVAPTLSFHRDFEFLAAAVSEEIEFYRFDLNENWQQEIKILRRH